MSEEYDCAELACGYQEYGQNDLSSDEMWFADMFYGTDFLTIY